MAAAGEFMSYFISITFNGSKTNPIFSSGGGGGGEAAVEEKEEEPEEEEEADLGGGMDMFGGEEGGDY